MRALHIGIDCSILEKQETGAGRYVRRIVDGVSALGPAVHVYLPRPLSLTHGGRVSTRMLPWKVTQGITRAALGSAYWPIYTRLDGLDVFHEPSYFLPFGIKCPCVMTIYDLRVFQDPSMCPRRRAAYLEWCVPSSAKRATRIITISNFIKSQIVKVLGVPETRVDVTHLACDPVFSVTYSKAALESTRARYGLPDKFLLAVGWIEPRKNLRRLVHALKILRQSGIERPLIIVGPSGYRGDELTRAIAEFDMSRHVRAFGYIENESLAAMYNLAEAFVFPSLYEGFGIPTLEAMACGAPVVTSNTTSFPEVVGSAGVLVDPLEPEAIADGIARVVRDPEFRLYLSRLGRQRVREFSWARTAQQTLTAYRAAAAPGRKAG